MDYKLWNLLWDGLTQWKQGMVQVVNFQQIFI